MTPRSKTYWPGFASFDLPLVNLVTVEDRIEQVFSGGVSVAYAPVRFVFVDDHTTCGDRSRYEAMPPRVVLTWWL